MCAGSTTIITASEEKVEEKIWEPQKADRTTINKKRGWVLRKAATLARANFRHVVFGCSEEKRKRRNGL